MTKKVRFFEEIIIYFDQETVQKTVKYINNKLQLITRIAYKFINLINVSSV